MDITKQTKKLDAMIGKTFTHYRDGEVTFEKWSSRGENIKIETSAGEIKVSIFDLPLKLQEYKTPETAMEITPEPEYKKPDAGSLIRCDVLPKSHFQKLSEILMDNIAKVQQDAGYINQASEISKSAQTLINLAKLEVEIKTKL